MRKLQNYFIIFSVILIGCTSAFAQENLTLTLEQSVKMALQKNPEIKMAEKELAKAKASITESYSAILPQLSASASFQKSWEIQTNTIPNFLKFMLRPQPGTLPPDLENIFLAYTNAMPDFVSLSFGLENMLVYGATVTQPLFLGGAGVTGIKMSYAGARAAEQNLRSVKQNLIYNTSNAFYSCLLAKELVNVQEEALKQTEANLSVVIKKYNVGMASGFDKMRAEVEAANLKPQVISARNNFKLALTHLRTILGLEKNVSLELQGSFEFADDDFGSMTLEEIQTLALKNRPEIHAFEEQKYITHENIVITRSNFLPKLFFQTDYSYLAMRNDYNFRQDDFSKGFTSAISLQIPLFTGLRNAKQYQKARLDYKIMLDTEKQIQDGIYAEVEVAYNTFYEAKEKYMAANQSESLAREALRLANMMYEEGTNTQLDVLNSQLALTQARLNYVSSLYEYQMARYQLRKVTGMLNDIL